MGVRSRTWPALVPVLVGWFGASASAQTIQLSENFTVPGGCPPTAPFTYLPAGWTRFNVDNRTPNSSVAYVTEAWTVRDDILNVSNCVAFSTSWYEPVGAANDFMCTPQVPLANGPNLHWRASTYDPGFPDGYEVRVMTQAPAGGPGNIGNLLSGTVVFAVGAENTTFTQHHVDLGALGFANQSVYVCFRNNSDDRFLLAVDDVVIDNVTVNFSVTQADWVSEYTRVPFWGGHRMVPRITVSNFGGVPITNVVVTAQALRDGLPSGAFAFSAPIPSLASPQMEVAVFSDTLPIDAPGVWSVRYVVTADQIDTGPADNTTDSPTLIAVANEIARDVGDVVGVLGIGAGNGGEIGAHFDLPENAVVRGIRFVMGDNNDEDWVGQSIVANLRAWNAAGSEPGAVLFTTAPWVATATGATVEALFTAGPQLLRGRFVATVVEPPVPNATLSLAQYTYLFREDTTWVDWPTSPAPGWINLEDIVVPGIQRAQGVRLLLQQPPDVLLSDGFENPPPPSPPVIARPLDPASAHPSTEPTRRTPPPDRLVPGATLALAPGTYYAAAQTSLGCEVYLDQACATPSPTDPANATPIVVTGPGPVPGIDFTSLGPAILATGFED